MSYAVISRESVVTEQGAELLRLSTCGSVDDGKSTLIGRLLHDTKNVLEDQLAQVEEASRRRGDDYTNLALLTDGLRAEREQGITIDVAYRYFATAQRNFIVADTPGHIQYTRNMVTGASTANLAIVLVDARKGLVEQSRRHSFIASLLRIPHLVFAVNKMDLVAWDEQVLRRIETEVRSFANQLELQDSVVIPMSALKGDNVVTRSENMLWYHGPTLLQHLEMVHIGSDRNLSDVRFPVQSVIRPQSDDHPDYRGYTGQVAGGILKPGDRVVVLPSGLGSRVARIETYDGPVEEAFAPMSVTIHIEDEIDVSRGDMICGPQDQPLVGQELHAMICWMTDKPLRPRARLALKQTTRWVRAIVTHIDYELDVNTLQRKEHVEALERNAIGRLQLQTTAPIFYDAYRRNRTTGSFILVDETTNATVAAGMLLDPPR
jgi:bifunctional enzyme CysN/CysC